MIKRTIVYIRSLKDSPQHKQQEDRIRAALTKSFKNVYVYIEKDNGSSKVLRTIMNSLENVSGCVLVVWRIDAIAELFVGFEGLIEFIVKLRDNDHHFVSVEDGIDSRNEIGLFLSTLLNSYKTRVSYFKTERQRSALSRLSAKGAKVGRPKSYTLSQEKVLQMKNEGRSLASIARELGVSSTTVHRLLNQ